MSFRWPYAPVVFGPHVVRSVNINTVWTVIFRCGQLEQALTRLQSEHSLHAAFAKCPFTDDDRAIVVLKRRAQYLAGRDAL